MAAGPAGPQPLQVRGLRRGAPGQSPQGSRGFEEAASCGGVPRGRSHCPRRGRAGRAGSREGGRPACWAGAVQALVTQPGALPCLAHSIIRGVNQDRFIQRAVEAANAYSSILRAVQAAEGAAGQALQQASHAWAVRPWRCPQPPREPLPTPAPIGWVRTLFCPRTCRRWYGRAWGHEPGSCGPTAVAWGKPPSGSNGGWTTVSAAPTCMSGLCGDPQALGSVWVFVGATHVRAVAALCGNPAPH